MTYHDVTVPIRSGMPVFEGDPPVLVERVSTLAGAAACNLSVFSGSLHTGTHVDAPVHFIEGAGGVETLSPETLIGDCLVVDASRIRGLVSADDVAGLVPGGAERVLFRTTNGALWDLDGFFREYVALAAEAASELIDRGARLVGIDYLSVAPFDDPAPVHRALLEAGVVILEGLDLRRRSAGQVPAHLPSAAHPRDGRRPGAGVPRSMSVALRAGLRR